MVSWLVIVTGLVAGQPFLLEVPVPASTLTDCKVNAREIAMQLKARQLGVQILSSECWEPEKWEKKKQNAEKQNGS